jgi:hypothetical protein
MAEAQPETPAPVAEAPAASTMDQDDALAWLESLAAKQGAKPEELLTDPNARTETPPAWVTESMAEAQPASQPAEDATGIWLRDLEEPAVAVESDETLFTDSSAQVSDWLSALDAADEVESRPAPIAREEQPAAEATVLPDWLSGLEEKAKTPAVRVDTGELPDWLREPEPPAQPEPTMPTDWRPLEAELETGLHFSPEPQAEQKPEIIYSPPLEPEPVVEALPQPTPEPEPAPEPVKFEAPPEPTFKPAEIDFRPEPPSPKPARPAPAVKKTPARKETPVRRYTGMLTPPANLPLTSAQSEMNRGDIPAALEHYGKLIRKGKWLEDIIRDLREALYRYPVEVSIWQTLGDAYMRENRLQEALDAYTKAEELLR